MSLLRNISPVSPGFDSTNRLLGNSESVSNGLLGSCRLEDSRCLLISELRGRVGVPDRRCAVTDFISMILHGGRPRQMERIDAMPVSAGMRGLFISRIPTSKQDEGGSMGVFTSPPRIASNGIPFPQNAFIGSAAHGVFNKGVHIDGYFPLDGTAANMVLANSDSHIPGYISLANVTSEKEIRR